MTSRQDLKAEVCRIIDSCRQEIIDLGETILRNPETGFDEINTADLVAERLRGLGIEPLRGLAITGVKGRRDCDATPPPSGS